MSPMTLISTPTTAWKPTMAGLEARLRPTRGLKRDRTASVVIRGHAFVQNLRRGHYELGVNARNHHLRVAAAFDELAETI
jgi:IS6 family transposase